MNQESLSTKLTRIKTATNSIRRTLGVESDIIEDVAVATDTKITELNTEITAKDEALTAKTLELEETIRNKEVEIAEAVTEATAAKDLEIAEKTATIKEIGKFRRYDSRAAILAETEPVEGNQAVALKVEDALESETPTLKSITLKSVIYLPEGKTQADYYALWNGEMLTTYFISPDNSTRFSIRTESTRVRIECYGDDIQVSGYYTFSETGTSNTVWASLRVTDPNSGTSQTISGVSGVFTHQFSEPLTLRSNGLPMELLKLIIESINVTYEGMLTFKDNAWGDIDLGETQTASLTPIGKKVLTSQGLQEGTFGTFGTDLEQAKMLKTFFDNAQENPIDLSGLTVGNDYYKQGPIKQLYGDLTTENGAMHPLLLLTDFSKMSGEYMFSYLTTNFKIDFNQVKPEYRPVPTSVKGMFNYCNVKEVDMSCIDFTKVTSFGEMATPDWSQNTEGMEPLFESIQNALNGHDYPELTGIGHMYRYGRFDRLHVKDMHLPKLRGVGSWLKWSDINEVFIENVICDTPLSTGTDMFMDASVKEFVIKNCHLKFDETVNTTYNRIENFSFAVGGSKLETIILHTDEFVNFYCSDTPGIIYPSDSYLVAGIPAFKSGGVGKLYMNDEFVEEAKTSKYYRDIASHIYPISELPQDLIEKYGFEEIVAAYKEAAE